MLCSDLNSGSIIPKSLDFSSPKIWLKCSLYSKNCFFLTSGYLLQAPDNLNFFRYPLKVWVVRSRLYFRNPVKGILWTINRDKKNFIIQCTDCMLWLKFIRRVQLIKFLLYFKVYIITIHLSKQPKETWKFQPRKKPEPQQNYMTCIFVTDYLWIKRLYILL